MVVLDNYEKQAKRKRNLTNRNKSEIMIETKRLIIKPLSYEQLLKYAQCDNSLGAEMNLDKSSRVVSAELKEALENTIIPAVADETKNYLYSTLWTAISKTENKMVGDFCMFGEPSREGEIEIGYGTHKEFQKMGYMTEIVSGIIEWCKTQPNIKTIIASTDKPNVASFKVLENNHFQKFGESETQFHWKLIIK